MSTITEKLAARCQGQCELCNNAVAATAYLVSPKTEELPQNEVALCTTCLSKINSGEDSYHWRCLEGSIWSTEASVQALSYRILQQYKNEEWAAGTVASVDLDEDTVQWAMSAFEVAEVHKDAFGNELANGDTVVLTQALNVKGANFTASKGTVVKRIRLVPENTGQIEGKINEQTIVILTKFVKKG